MHFFTTIWKAGSRLFHFRSSKYPHPPHNPTTPQPHNPHPSLSWSLQNALEVALESLDAIPAYGHREVLLLYSALGTCDPGDILGTVQKCQVARIRCSVVGLAAELYICRQLCEKTGGGYSVAMNEVGVVGRGLFGTVWGSAMRMVVVGNRGRSGSVFTEFYAVGFFGMF